MAPWLALLIFAGPVINSLHLCCETLQVFDIRDIVYTLVCLKKISVDIVRNILVFWTFSLHAIGRMVGENVPLIVCFMMIPIVVFFGIYPCWYIDDLRVKRAGLGARNSALARSVSTYFVVTYSLFTFLHDLRVKRAGLGARSSALIRSILRKVLRVKRAGLGARISALIRTVFFCVKRVVFLDAPDLRVKRAGLGARISALIRSVLRKVLRVKRAGLGARISALREYTMWEGLVVVVIPVIFPHKPSSGGLGGRIPG